MTAKYMRALSGEPERIVCLHLNQIGDLLFSLPALYNLRARFPGAHIISVARPSCCELLAGSGLVNATIERQRGGINTELQLVRRLRRERIDLVLLFSTSFATWTIAQLSAARVKSGFTDSLGGFMLHDAVPWSPPPSTENNLRLVESIGCPVVKKDYAGLITPSDEHRRNGSEVLGSIGISPTDRYVVLSPGTSEGREIKCWVDNGFAQLADLLARDFGLRSVIVGLGGGSAICKLSEHAMDLTGKTSVTTLAAVLDRAVVFVGVDSGVMHLAGGVGTPVIGLFGPTNPAKTGPQGDRCRIIHSDMACHPCMRKRCDRDAVCMKAITPSMVMDAVSSLIHPFENSQLPV
jgi:ADP-heptose:LPS heptosyltransferase